MKTYLEILEDYKVLETNRLILRPVTFDDAPDMFEYASDERTVKYLTFAPHSSLGETKQAIDNFFINKPEVYGRGLYGIVLKETSKFIGAIDIRPDDQNKKASFGYVLNKNYWNNGYMTEALKCIMKVCFDILKVNRIESTHYEGNEASGKVMQKCGMKYEGKGTEELYIKGEFVNVLHYAILEREYTKLDNKTTNIDSEKCSY